MPLNRLFAAAALAIIMPGNAQALDSEIESHPDDAVRAYYQENQSEIDNLLAELAPNAVASGRRDAFAKLALDYPAAAEIAARSLVTDSEDALALDAIALLKGALVMSDHHAPASAAELPPRIAHMMKRHAASLDALRAALIDERPTLREAAASFLAGLSDAESLEMIADGAEEGLYSDLEAANLYTLASGDVGLKYLEAYLDKGDVEAQQTAIGYLGAVPAYQDQIRTSYFLNPEASSETRAQAAKTLSAYDASFPEYALIVAGDENVDASVFEATISGYVNTQTSKNRLDPYSARIVSDQVNRYLTGKSLPEETLKQIESLGKRIDAIAEQ